MSAVSVGNLKFCRHIFCVGCFTNANETIDPTNYICPCCKKDFYKPLISFEQAKLMGMGAFYMLQYKSCHFPQQKEQIAIQANKVFEMALAIDSTHLECLQLIVYMLHNYALSIITAPGKKDELGVATQQIHDYCMGLLECVKEYTDERGVCSLAGIDYCHYALADSLVWSSNFDAALPYSKLAYLNSMRSGNHSLDGMCQRQLGVIKNSPFKTNLRFSVGDVVQCHVAATDSWWEGKVVEIHYHEKVFALSYNAPYRIRLIEELDPPEVKISDEPMPVFIVVNNDIDRFIRRPGTRAIESTRYHAKREGKFEAMSNVYCSKQFMVDVHQLLKEDPTFGDTLYRNWHVNLAIELLLYYRVLIMYRTPFVRTDTGYHVPTLQEVADGLKAFFPVDDSYRNLKRRAAASPDDKRLQLRLADLIRLQHIDGVPTRPYGDSRVIYEHVDTIETSCERIVNEFSRLHHFANRTKPSLSNEEHRTEVAALFENGFSTPFPSPYP